MTNKDYIDKSNDNAKLSTNKKITFDGNGGSVTLTAGRLVVSEGTMIFRNGTINVEADRTGIEIEKNGKVYLNTSSDNSTSFAIKNTYATTKTCSTEAIKMSGNSKLYVYPKAIIHSGNSKSSSARVMDIDGEARVEMHGGEVRAQTNKDGVGGTVINAEGKAIVLISGTKLQSDYISYSRCVFCTHNSAKVKFSSGTAYIKAAKKGSKGFGFVLSAHNSSLICYNNKSQFTFGFDKKYLCDADDCEGECKNKKIKWKPTSASAGGDYYLINSSNSSHKKACANIK